MNTEKRPSLREAARRGVQAKQQAAPQPPAVARVAQPPAPTPTPAPRPRQSSPVPRLPDGARFDVRYEAAAERWSGTLSIPGLEPLTASASGVFRLLRWLDGMYRDATAAPGEGTTTTTETPG